jgi:hypothetical protein
VNRRTGFRIGGVLLALLPLAAVLAASAPASSADAAKKTQEDEQLDEVLVNGTRIRAVRDPQKVLDWFARLVGKFTYEGQVDLHGQGRDEDKRSVHGMQDCVGFGPAPAVHCTINAIWPESRGPQGEQIPGGVSTLNPAMLLFGFEPDHIGIRYMLVDDKGVAQGALGLLMGDTLTSKTPCVDLPGDCQRSVRITAQPDGQALEMHIDLERDGRPAIAYAFVLHRMPGTPAVVIGAQQRP